MPDLDVEQLLRTALVRAQADAPVVDDLLAGAQRRRESRRRTGIAVVVAAVVAAAAVAVPLALLRGNGAAENRPLRPGISTPFGPVTAQWRMRAAGQIVTVGAHAFTTNRADWNVLFRLGDDGLRKLNVAALGRPGLQPMLFATEDALYATASNQAASHQLWRIDPKRFTVTRRVTLPGGAFNVSASATNVYVWSHTTIYRLDPTSLAVTGSFAAHTTASTAITSVAQAGSDVYAVVGALRQLPRPSTVQLQRLTSDLTPVETTAVTLAANQIVTLLAPGQVFSGPCDTWTVRVPEGPAVSKQPVLVHPDATWKSLGPSHPNRQWQINDSSLVGTAPCGPTDGTALAAIYSGPLRIGVARPLSLVELRTDDTNRHAQTVLKRWDLGTSDPLLWISVSDGQLWLSRKNEVQRIDLTGSG